MRLIVETLQAITTFIIELLDAVSQNGCSIVYKFHFVNVTVIMGQIVLYLFWACMDGLSFM